MSGSSTRTACDFPLTRRVIVAAIRSSPRGECADQCSPAPGQWQAVLAFGMATREDAAKEEGRRPDSQRSDQAALLCRCVIQEEWHDSQLLVQLLVRPAHAGVRRGFGAAISFEAGARR